VRAWDENGREFRTREGYWLVEPRGEVGVPIRTIPSASRVVVEVRSPSGETVTGVWRVTAKSAALASRTRSPHLPWRNAA